MPEEVPAFLWAEFGNNATDPAHETRDCVLGRLAQMRLHFAEGGFDRVEIRRIRRKMKQRRARCFDRLLDAGNLVSRKIVHDDDIAALECWNKALFHISKKHWSIHGSFEYERSDHRTMSQAGDESECFPMSVRRVADQPLSARTPPSKPNHAGVRPRFVDKYQSGRVKHALVANPAPARAGHVRAMLLGRVQRFF